MKAGHMLKPLRNRLSNSQKKKRLEKVVRRWYAKHPLSDEVIHALTGK
jgi:hypothetical protein